MSNSTGHYTVSVAQQPATLIPLERWKTCLYPARSITSLPLLQCCV